MPLPGHLGMAGDGGWMRNMHSTGKQLHLAHAIQLQENKKSKHAQKHWSWEINILKCELCLAKNVY